MVPRTPRRSPTCGGPGSRRRLSSPPSSGQGSPGRSSWCPWRWRGWSACGTPPCSHPTVGRNHLKFSKYGWGGMVWINKRMSSKNVPFCIVYVTRVRGSTRNIRDLFLFFYWRLPFLLMKMDRFISSLRIASSSEATLSDSLSMLNKNKNKYTIKAYLKCLTKKTVKSVIL